MKKTTPEETLPLATTKPASTLALQQEPSTGQLLRLIIEKGITGDNVGVIERLIALQERRDAKDAEKAFAVAFHDLQQAMPPIQAVEAVPDKQGNVKYYFAPYSHIMAEVGPLLLKHGFSVMFDSEFKEARFVMRCTLIHVGGHSKTTTQYMRVSAPYGANDSQADGATTTMAKRYALCSALNIVIDHDTDARNEGEPISFEQAQTLRELVHETKSNEVLFLKYAGAEKYEEIGSARYQELFRQLQARL